MPLVSKICSHRSRIMRKDLLGRRGIALLVGGLIACAGAWADTPPLAPDIPKSFTVPTATNDYEKRVAHGVPGGERKRADA